MIQIPRRAVLQLFCALALSLSITIIGITKPRKKTAAARPTASRAADQSKRSKAKQNSKTKSSARRNDTSKSRTSAREKREASSTRALAKSGKACDNRKLSRRARLLEARREAERRQREREEAARRAEIARQAALARIRALNQGLRDETVANIALDDTTGEDLDVRRAAIAALGNHAGTIVVMNPQNGRVYSIVNQEWAVRRGFKPCSTIKLLTGLAGFCEQVVTPASMVKVNGGDHNADMMDALARSSNHYFEVMGGRVGFDRMMKYARELGLGEQTGINHANESPGRVPLYKAGYAVNHMSSHGDDFEVTPIQLATLTSAIGNGGKLLVPHLPRTPEEDANFKTEERRRINVPQEMLSRLVPGMIGAVNYGSAKLAYDETQTIAGKTGSCTGQGSKLGLFASYAPVHDPRLAVVVILRSSSARGSVAAGVAGNIYRTLNYRFGRKGNEPLAAARGTLAPRRSNPAIIFSSSEEDEAETAATTTNGESLEADANAGKVRSVVMPVQSRPTNVTIQPARQPASVQPQTSTSPTTTNQTVNPMSQPTSQRASEPSDSARPRRVLTTSP